MEMRRHTKIVYWVVALDSILLGIGLWLVMAHLVSLYTLALLVFPILLPLNFLIIWKVSRTQQRVLTEAIPMSKLRGIWVLMFMFAMVTLGQLLHWIRKPNLLSAAQVISESH